MLVLVKMIWCINLNLLPQYTIELDSSDVRSWLFARMAKRTHLAVLRRQAVLLESGDQTRQTVTTHKSEASRAGNNLAKCIRGLSGDQRRRR